MPNVIDGQSTVAPRPFEPVATQHGDHERLFSLLEAEGPAPADFMLFLNDPVLDRENPFEDLEDEGYS